jgi:hypothetical protein
MTPTYEELAKELQSALDTLVYLSPETYDDETHKEAFLAELARVQTIIDESKSWKGRDYV